MTLHSGVEKIESDRLILRRMNSSDLSYFVAIHSDVDVARYIGAGRPRSEAETQQWFNDIVASYEKSNLGQLTIIRKSDGALLGRCGLSDAAIERQDRTDAPRKGWFFSTHVPAGIDFECVPELGYTLGKENWGQGYASEATRCVFQYARGALNFETIMSVIHADNAASLAVAKKFGVAYVDRIEMAGRSFDRYHWPMAQTF